MNTRPRTPPESRFWDKVDKDGPVVRPDLGPCWLWTASKAGGYGTIGLDRRTMVYAHRLSLEMKLGRPIQPGMQALHDCDTKLCVNPDHLYEGTQADNVRDMLRRGRHAPTRPSLRGTKNRASRLTEDQVREIRSSPASGVELARRFGVSGPLISYVRSGKVWGWLK